jgi:hypothetical protein
LNTTTRTQIGILFGFVAAFIIVIESYGEAWRVYNKREERKEAARKASLIEREFGAGEIEGEKGKSREPYGHWQGMGGQVAACTTGPAAGSGQDVEVKSR